MTRIFDINRSCYWFDVDNAKAYVDEKFEEYMFFDRDHSCTYVIEVWENGEHTIFSLNVDGWWGVKDGNLPDHYIVVSPADDVEYKRYRTSLKPDKDYIIL